jgi:dTDP-glucose 4,6-dehydratase
MTRLLITGGAGFIGANLVHRALETSAHHVVVVDKITYASSRLAVETLERNPRVTLIRADIADAEAMARVFDDHRPVAVMNLAAETHVDRSIDSPRAFVETNVLGTFVLLEQARRLFSSLDPAGRDAFRFLHISTDEVFGSLGPDGSFSEITPYDPRSPYSASKAGADHLVRAYYHTYGLPALITNCSNNYGPYQHPEKLIPLMVLNALEARKLPIYGDGKNVRDWLHVDDHCAALLLVLQRGRPGESYNVGANNEQPNIVLVDRLCATLDAALPAASNPAMRSAGLSSYSQLKTYVTDRPGHDRRYAIDNTKLRTELGWAPAWTFERGLDATVRWYVEHRESFAAAQSGYDRQRLGLGATASAARA